MPSLSELPLPLAIMVAAFWIINQNNATFAKQLIALIDAFDKDYAALLGKYDALFQMVWEDRKESQARWVERDRQLVAIAQETKEAQVKNANETHALRNTLAPMTTAFQQMYRFIEETYRVVVPNRRSNTRHTGDNPDGN